MTERPKVHDWKSCVPGRVPRVQIPLSPFMEKSVLRVNGMSCMHCVNTIKNAVSALPGVALVSVDLPGKTVTVEHDGVKCPLQTVKAKIEDQGYEVMG